MIRNHIGLMQY